MGERREPWETLLDKHEDGAAQRSSAESGRAVELLKRCYTRMFDGEDREAVRAFLYGYDRSDEPQSAPTCDQCPEPMDGPHHPECYRFTEPQASSPEACPKCQNTGACHASKICELSGYQLVAQSQAESAK